MQEAMHIYSFPAVPVPACMSTRMGTSMRTITRMNPTIAVSNMIMKTIMSRVTTIPIHWTTTGL